MKESFPQISDYSSACPRKNYDINIYISFSCLFSLTLSSSSMYFEYPANPVPFANKGHSSQSCDFSSTHVWIWELDHKEGWAPKNWCFRTVGLEKTLENPLDSKEIKPVNPKGNQSWILTGRTDAEAPILRPPYVKNQLIGKDPDAGEDWRLKDKRVAEDEMVR